MSRERADHSETDGYRDQRSKQRDNHAGVPAIYGYRCSNEYGAGNAKQLARREEQGERCHSPEAFPCQEAADALRREAPRHTGRPGHDPNAKNHEN